MWKSAALLGDKNRNPRPWGRDVFLLVVILGSLFFFLLGSRPLFVPDEGRYAEIAREMVTTKNYIIPHLNYLKYFEKPVLFYWLETAAISISGLDLWSLRSINALFGLLGCLLTYGFARKFYDEKTGFLAALILGTSTLYFVMARMITLDVPVTFFLMGCLYSFYLSVHEEQKHKRRLYSWGTFIFAALAVLTKGLIGIIFPLLIISVWLTVLSKWRILKQLYLPSGIFIFCLIAFPWHILVGLQEPDFFYFYFITQHFLRYTDKKIGHYQPIWFFVPYLALGFFPWIVFLPQTITKLVKRKLSYVSETSLFLLIFAVIIFSFFSFSKSKLIPYILPVLPPLSILVANYLKESIQQKNTRGITFGFIVLFFSACLMMVLCYLFLDQAAFASPISAKKCLYLAVTIFSLGSLSLLVYPFRYFNHRILLLCLTTWLTLLMIFSAFSAIDKRSILPLATILRPLLTPESEVITFNKYYQDLPFYLERRVSILNWQNELTYGMTHQNGSRAWMINNQAFWKRWHGRARAFAVIDLSEYHDLKKSYPNENLFLLGKTLENALISNQK
jgi:4-amino-4-deoxy-L-arabinose transferase-like glycosyltransferase